MCIYLFFFFWRQGKMVGMEGGRWIDVNWQNRVRSIASIKSEGSGLKRLINRIVQWTRMTYVVYSIDWDFVEIAAYFIVKYYVNWLMFSWKYALYLEIAFQKKNRSSVFFLFRCRTMFGSFVSQITITSALSLLLSHSFQFASSHTWNLMLVEH